ncbi:MAG: hypothetical protein A9Z00_15330 [Thermobacillus sp. ZCTH02-B1]|uniref:YitT family protein n=1 Tax=Thermobacillus sp. ZCTH02-B1 TaxID=1858795 RepID=UPI000B56BD8C|nr:YitT family protein [Thermobacillus sp. ZCTH02-B1]OUM94463.1 MAG: hypothetical protein A9Z00_15330 [Thermobacillus sp. ZCTH02-B1]
MTCAAALIAFGFNFLLIPHRLLSGGVSGVSMLLSYATGLDAGILYFALNLPILIWGWYALGHAFIYRSIYNVAATSLLLRFAPVHSLAADPILAAVFGGVAVGLGTGLALRWGGSSGGLDIVASIVTRRREVPIGMLILAMNMAIVLLQAIGSGNWQGAMYSMLSMYVSGKVIDTVHIRQLKVTAFIISSKPQELLARLRRLPRGVSVVPIRGGYTGEDKVMLMTVTTRYELSALRALIRETDPKAFVNIVETVSVMGDFRKV